MFVSKGYKTAKIEQVHTEPKRLKLKDSGPAKVERRISEVRLFSLVSKLVPLYLSLSSLSPLCLSSRFTS